MASEKLTAMAVSDAKYSGKPHKLTDGKGLYLYITKHGKYWRYDYRYGGKRKTFSIGVFPEVSLATARKRLQDARNKLSEGIDPSYHKQVAKLAGSGGDTFKDVAEEWLQKRAEWSDGHRRTVRQRLDNDLLPYIGNRPLQSIEPAEVLAVLRRVEARGAIESAHRIKTLASQVFRFGVATTRIASDPTRDLQGALAKHTEVQLPSITDPAAVGELLRAIDSYTGNPIVLHALQLAPHVFVRPGELRGALWSEINFEEALWTIPARRMKRKLEHKVPLSNQSLAILKSLHHFTGAGTLVFPGMREDTRPISDMTLNAALRRLGYASGEVCIHGFRHTASTLLNERRDFDPDLIEAQLSHVDGNGVRRAYNQAQYVELRRSMMQDYSDYLDSLKQLR
ncbi:tyrosine-type recombinase/integrase [Granulosicoccus sp. 3-233]|uniref:tyrosine-type recombinase/integrase n=1 Tax=Granulosicoccus sp. 3-233 TaxID=3417969 RepID=UPI003D34A68C